MLKLKSKIFVIKDVKKVTNAVGFSELRIGDRIQFDIELMRTHGYATDVTITDLTRSKTWRKSQSELLNILNRTFILEEETSTL